MPTMRVVREALPSTPANPFKPAYKMKRLTDSQREYSTGMLALCNYHLISDPLVAIASTE